MRLLIDIGHPGHVHYFRHLYQELKRNNNEILVIARDKEVTFKLLQHYNIPFISRGKGKKSIAGKMINLLSSSYLIFRFGLKFKPEIILSFASPYASIAAFLLRCSNIVLDDTEVGRFERIIYKPFSTLILTPKVFKKELGKKQIRFNGYMELSYLMPGKYKPNAGVLSDLGLKNREAFILMRFVSWEASHDKGQRGLTLHQKREILDLCCKNARVFISSEKELPEEFEKYRLKIDPSQLHDALFFASAYIGEGATTASEACMLGTPAIYINTITAGTIEDQERHGLLYHFSDYSGIQNRIVEVLSHDKNYFKEQTNSLLKGKLDITNPLVWLVENNPNSINEIFKNPEIFNS